VNHVSGVAPGIALRFWRDLGTAATPKSWLIRGVMACAEVSSWIGRPGGGKSALLTDIAVHVALGRDWRGYRTLQRTGVVYFALERADLVERRLLAHRLREGLPNDLPIAVAGQIIDLCAPGCVDLIIDAINRAQDGFGCEAGLAIIDTRAKGIAAGGGDENSARDQNRAAANIRRVIERTRVHTAVAGHTGKEPGRGERGSNASLGDVDVEVTISGDATRTAVVTKANDQPLGPLTAYDLEQYELGAYDDGQPYGTWIVARQSVVAPPLRPAPPAAKPRPLSDRQRLALEALSEVTLSVGQPAPAAYGLPAAVRVVNAEGWRAELRRRGILGETRPRAAWDEIRTSLQARHVIGVRDSWVWDAR
jgi:hypothetical protein